MTQAGVAPEQIEHVDLYTCFPIAAQASLSVFSMTRSVAQSPGWMVVTRTPVPYPHQRPLTTLERNHPDGSGVEASKEQTQTAAV